jgi:hypothetical protein
MNDYDLRYKESNTTRLLAQLTDVKLKVSGVEDKETRKLVLAAIRKAGYTAQPSGSKPKPTSDNSRSLDEPVAGPSESRVASAVQVVVSPHPVAHFACSSAYRPRQLSRNENGTTTYTSSFQMDLQTKLLRTAAWSSMRS